MKLEIINVDTKSKMLSKLGSLAWVSVCGQKVQKATAIVTLITDTCEAWVYVHAHTHVNSPYFVASLRNSRL